MIREQVIVICGNLFFDRNYEDAEWLQLQKIIEKSGKDDKGCGENAQKRTI